MPTFPPGVHLIGGRNAAPVHRQQAREFYAPLLALVLDLREQGLPLRAIAGELDNRGVKTRHGRGGWTATQVRRVLERARGADADQPATAEAVTPADKCCHADRSSSRPVRILDAAELAAAGVLVPGIFKAGRWGWWEGDQLEATVGYHVDTRTPPGTLILSGLGEAVSVALALVGGGDALAFRCPGCWSTTARLYLPEGDAVWRCAGCHSLGDSPGGREAS